ncbi:acyl-CoA thioesterase [Tateyamaria sp. ANG-S1]|uniref:acyl-CoA thioesterase n=1 Tax=Tateyamaria sp. ANG-S1 TaxID=1577905 RepID=UPI00057F03DD|nr:acyl-CoA thioesterase [Tateyamaria sp. ANG-S1]KIC48677.1 thioesterase [Tateyamaria sp. ANG-S1]
MAFEVHQRVLFRHCDPAGIVFYPRYFEMINDALESFFDQAIGAPWDQMHQNAGVPTAEISARFTAPSRQGDELTMRLEVNRVGRSSMDYTMGASAAGELRFEAKGTMVFVNHAGKSTPWPDKMRAKLQEQKELAA